MRFGILIFTFFCSIQSQSADWPQFKADAGRTGYTPEPLAEDLNLRWVYHPAHAPMPAWQAEMRMPFDHAHQVTVAEGLAFFGSSADGKVYALDADTGKEKWTFFTEGPVRFAPAYWKGKVFAPSDDGFLYCLNASNGSLIWKKRGGPNSDLILGNDRMISHWPVRGAPAIVDDILYYAAGIWPSEGIFIYAIDPETGETLWVNEDSGGMEMDQPHGGARAKSGVSAQGYLIANKDFLFLPTGRAVPAAFNRNDGSFRYFHLQSNRRLGGSNALATDDYLLISDAVFEASGGENLGSLGQTVMAASPKDLVYSQGRQLAANHLVGLATLEMTADRKGEETTKWVLKTKPFWTMSVPHSGATSLIIAGDEVVSGTHGRVSITDIEANSVVWSENVAGVPLGLAAAGGRLFVSTDDGAIYCFGGDQPDPIVHRKEKDADPYGENATYAQAAKEILEKSGVTEGYCLDLGCGDGALAYELAHQSNLRIFGIESDPDKLAEARAKLDSAGLYGTRITLVQGDPSHHPFPEYFANLVVSGRSVVEGVEAAPGEGVERSQRPYGGVACLGKPGAMQVSTRGELEGTGDWTHQYSNPANTICSNDQLVKGPLGILWFRDADQKMPQRHGRGPAPLFAEGVLVVEGMDTLRGADAYNGRTLWEYPLPGILNDYNQEHLVGAAATNSNFCVADGKVYVRHEDKCLRIDLHSGELLKTYTAPPPPDGRSNRTWGYIACEEGILYGSLSDEGHVIKKAFRESYMNNLFSESYFFFALDTETGEVKWTFEPRDSIRHNAIAIGEGKVFLIDRPKAPMDLADSVAKSRRRGQEPGGTEEVQSQIHKPGVLLALDSQSGDVLWKDEEDVYGTLLALSEDHDVLLMGYQDTRFKQSSEIGGRMSAYRAEEGSRLWDRNIERPMGYRSSSRPIINDRTVYLEPGAFDLMTGEDIGFSMERSYGCGMITSSENMMFFRSATLGYVDLEANAGTENFGGIRPGCWINAIPAGGLVLMPDATAGCTCSYLNRASIALHHYGTR
ncbi:MAG: PQQ-binding-like beta-propeller repeat protein [Candidatus Omnitrophica bacterium]|nr:PQQ-binding-like beta-propeller repeat protein [Candidatus Omnitrophota bacterium]